MKDFQEFLSWEKATRDIIDFKKSYVDMTGDCLAGLVLSEIVYWYLPSKDGSSKLRVKRKGVEWIVCSRHEWWDRCRLTPRQIDRVLPILVKTGLIEKRVHRFKNAPTTHVRLLTEVFIQKLNETIANPPVNPFLPDSENDVIHQTVKSANSPNGEIVNDETVKSSTTESTTSVTTSSKDIAPPENGAVSPAEDKPGNGHEPTPKKERPPCKWEPLHDALLVAFSLEKEQMTPKADKIYWTVAHELYVVKMTPDQIPAFHTYMVNKAAANKWSDWTVSAMAKYAPDFLKDSANGKPVAEFERGIKWVD